MSLVYSGMADAAINPKLILLQHKLALLVGPAECPIYNTISALHPNALEVPWSSDMSGTEIYVVFNNKWFSMLQVKTHSQAWEISFQPHAIDCGENIQLFLDDELFRDAKQALTMDWETLQRSEGIARRAVKSKWFFKLTKWVNRINGGPGRPSRYGGLSVNGVNGGPEESSRNRKAEQEMAVKHMPNGTNGVAD